MEKLSIIVSYRDREEHLKLFIPHMENSPLLISLDFNILIVEQTTKPFNRGKLLNVGALESPDASYFCFHDVDMLPEESDYSSCASPTHLATEAQQFGYKLPYNGYFGGVTLFDKHSFKKINGFSNEYWGWGAEDDDLLFRCLVSGVTTARRRGRYKSLDHERFIEKDLYTRNLHKLQEIRNSTKGVTEKIKEDGLEKTSYEIVNDIQISEKTRKITVNI